MFQGLCGVLAALCHLNPTLTLREKILHFPGDKCLQHDEAVTSHPQSDLTPTCDMLVLLNMADGGGRGAHRRKAFIIH